MNEDISHKDTKARRKNPALDDIDLRKPCFMEKELIIAKPEFEAALTVLTVTDPTKPLDAFNMMFRAPDILWQINITRQEARDLAYFLLPAADPASPCEDLAGSPFANPAITPPGAEPIAKVWKGDPCAQLALHLVSAARDTRWTADTIAAIERLTRAAGQQFCLAVLIDETGRDMMFDAPIDPPPPPT